MQACKLTLTLDEVNLILHALGTLPYQQVFQLIAKIQQEAQAQLKPNESPQESLSPPLNPPASDTL